MSKHGTYSLVWRLPGLGGVGQQVVDALDDVTVEPALAPELHAITGSSGFGSGTGVVYPSEAFGATTLVRLGSLLWWGAAAAASSADGERLRTLGVARFTHDAPADTTGLLLLLGDVKGRVWEAALGPSGQEQALLLVPLPALHVAAQAVATVPDGGASLVLKGAEAAPVALPLPAVRGWTHVVIACREADGRVEIHRYLLSNGADSDLGAARDREAAWRSLGGTTAALDRPVDALIDGDPLTAAVLAYADRQHLVAALARWGDTLPDGPVLRALVDPAAWPGVGRDGALPMVASGLTAWIAWRQRDAAANDGLPAAFLRPPVLGPLWTVLDAREGAGARPTPYAVPLASLLTHPPPWGDRVRAAVASTVRVGVHHAKYSEHRGTAFRVGPSLLLSATFAVGDAPVPLAVDRPVGSAAIVRSVGQVVELEGSPEGVGVAPTDNRAPVLGQRIGVIGFPVSTSYDLARLAGAFDVPPTGEGYILPGEVTRVEGDRVEYRAFTLAGMAGGPVVDLDTGRVIAVHLGGWFDEATGVKFGFGETLERVMGDDVRGGRSHSVSRGGLRAGSR